MAKLRITLACWDYDRTRALLEHRIALDGIAPAAPLSAFLTVGFSLPCCRHRS